LDSLILRFINSIGLYRLQNSWKTVSGLSVGKLCAKAYALKIGPLISSSHERK
jgi:hypothetical protein